MDRRDAMTFSGSASFYIHRGISGSGPGLQSGLSAGIRPFSTPPMPFQPNTGGSSVQSAMAIEASSAPISSPGVNMGTPSTVLAGEPLKRKRGRPRKYGPDGTVSLALSSSTTTPPGVVASTQKRGRGRPPGSGRKQQLASLGEWLSGTAGMGFTPHVITLSMGEDIAAKIMSFSQQGPRAVCILSANGAVSIATLRQPSTSGGTVTYEGRFEILCLSGSFLHAGDSGFHNQTGGLTVSLASPDGRVIGGGVGGMLIAASPVQIIVGSFSWGGSRTKNKKKDVAEASTKAEHEVGENQVTPNSAAPNQNLIPTSSVGMWPVDMRNTHVDIDLMRG